MTIGRVRNHLRITGQKIRIHHRKKLISSTILVQKRHLDGGDQPVTIGFGDAGSHLWPRSRLRSFVLAGIAVQSATFAPTIREASFMSTHADFCNISFPNGFVNSPIIGSPQECVTWQSAVCAGRIRPRKQDNHREGAPMRPSRR